VAAAPETAPQGKLWRGLGGALGTMAGLHIQYAQREAANDLGRLIGGVIIAAAAMLFVGAAIITGHVAATLYIVQTTTLTMLGAVLAVGGIDLALGMLLAIVARERLKRPMLKQTRHLVRQTVTNLVSDDV